jgi:molybdopterin converting factor small subunit
MATKVIVPTALRQYTDNQGTIAVEASTVGEALQQLTSQYSAIGNQLFDQNGNLRSFVNIYRNDDDVRYLQGMDTPVSDRDELSIIPAIAGGNL